MGGKNAAERNRGGTAAEQQNRTGGGTNMNAQRGRTGMEGLQGNASGMNVQLNERQRNEIRTTVINARGAPRIGHVDFDVTVGTVIPRGKVRSSLCQGRWSGSSRSGAASSTLSMKTRSLSSIQTT